MLFLVDNFFFVVLSLFTFKDARRSKIILPKYSGVAKYIEFNTAAGGWDKHLERRLV